MTTQYPPPSSPSNKNLQKHFCECLHPFANRSSITKIMKISFTLSFYHKPLAFSMMRVKLQFHLSFTLYLLWPPSLGQGWAKDGLFRSDWALITPKSNIIWKENNGSSWWKQASQEESAKVFLTLAGETGVKVQFHLQVHDSQCCTRGETGFCLFVRIRKHCCPGALLRGIATFRPLPFWTKISKNLFI